MGEPQKMYPGDGEKFVRRKAKSDSLFTTHQLMVNEDRGK